MDGVVHELIAEETRLKVHHIFSPAQSIFATSSVSRSPTPVPPAPVIGSIHVLIGVSQRFRKGFLNHLHHLGHHNSIHNRQFQQYKAFLATIQRDSTQAFAMTITHSGLHSSSPTERLPYFTLPPKTAPIAKEDLIYLDLLPSDVPTEEYSFTLDIVDISLPTTSLEVPDFPSLPATSSLSSLIHPAPLVYSRRRAAPPIPSSSSMTPSFDSGKPNLPAHRYSIRSRLVCRLLRALYGLKQSPRAWYVHFQAVVLQIGF
ncbi:hypothetical protein Acr_00g0049370 [Actinidia rufa]|uniref:Reverse transcriptase Ty1/copia-type domain-containing protein n=1 Tax=Actinidia rufa TaxID=165716 RepID=A0A7J0DKF7_9ERIC|nr:hypothetical protein Acr_00g0049370 [Actinidia rufa]